MFDFSSYRNAAGRRGLVTVRAGFAAREGGRADGAMSIRKSGPGGQVPLGEEGESQVG